MAVLNKAEGLRPQGLIHEAIQQTSCLSQTTSSFLQRLNPDSIARVHCGDGGKLPPRFVTAYWSTRGIGAAIRMLLASSAIPHWVLLYDVPEGEGGSWDKSSWIKDKSWLSDEVSPLINLPYLVDLRQCETGNKPIVITHSNAILSFLDRSVLALDVPDTSTTSMMEQLLCEVMDLRDAMVSFAYQPATDDAELEREGKRLISTTAQPMLQRLEKYLAGKWEGATLADDAILHLVDDRMCSPAYHLFEVLDQLNGLSSVVFGNDVLFSQQGEECTPQYPFLSRFRHFFRREASNQAYFSSELYKLPYNNPYARFGSDPSTLRSYKRRQAAPWRALGLFDIV